MNIRFLVLILLFTATACSNHTSRKNNQETSNLINKFSEAINQYNNQVVAPIMYLVSTACSKRHDNGTWPSIAEPTPQNSLFEENIILSKTPEYAARYKLKTTKDFWNVHLTYSDTEKNASCNGSIVIRSAEDKEIFQLPINMKVSKAKESLALPYESFQKKYKPVSFIIALALAADKKSNKQKTPEKNNNSFSVITEIVIAASICALLDSNPNQCPITLSGKRNTSKNKNDEMQLILNNKLKKLFNENN